MTDMQRYNLWLTNATADPELVRELEAIQGDPAAIEDRFYRELAFGTGGLRGVLGAGISCVPRCLKEHGFTRITLVEEQKNPDGHFPTCPYPNPEIRQALEAGLRWAEKTGSELCWLLIPTATGWVLRSKPGRAIS